MTSTPTAELPSAPFTWSSHSCTWGPLKQGKHSWFLTMYILLINVSSLVCPSVYAPLYLFSQYLQTAVWLTVTHQLKGEYWPRLSFMLLADIFLFCFLLVKMTNHCWNVCSWFEIQYKVQCLIWLRGLVKVHVFVNLFLSRYVRDYRQAWINVVSELL